MKRKWIALLVALVILTGLTTALAETPSKTTDDLTRIVKIEGDANKSVGALIWIEKEASEDAQKQMETIKTFVKKNTAMDFFSDEVQSQIKALVPAGTDLAKLKLSELVPLGIGDYKVEFGKVYCTFQFPTEFVANKTAVCVVGYLGSDGEMIWLPLETTIEDGNLNVVFPIELMEKIAHEAILTVLSN